MKKGIILGTVGLVLIGGVVYGIKKIAELVEDDYEYDYCDCEFHNDEVEEKI